MFETPDVAAMWPQLERLLDEALDRPAAEREAWLAALAPEHAGLSDTLRRLLQAHRYAETRDFLGVLPALAVPAETGQEGQAGLPQAQDLVGPYRLLRELGRGGMGTVWLAARDDGQLKREVALKLPQLNWARGLAERMARERDILATLEHPHIARLYDAGVDAQGRPWLALEYVQGQPIDSHARTEGLSVKRRLRLLLQVCEAVAYAHSRLVIHRDLKPANILVTDGGEVKLLDFGIAKLTQGDTTQATALTQLGGLAMTLDYASPEQVRGEPLSTASDVYSLGVVAYELLAGQRPYRLKRGSAAELEEAITSAELPLASSRGADAVTRKALRGDLDAILNKALKKTVAERYATADALAQDIARHLRSEAVLARPDALAYRAARFLRRHRLPVAAGVAVAVALIGGTGVALWQAQQARQQAERARLESERANVVGNFMLDSFARIAADPALRSQGGRERIGDALRTELQRVEPQAAIEPGAVAEVFGAAASIFNYLQQPAAQIEAARKELLYLQRAGESPEHRAEAHRNLALALSRQGQPEAAIAECQAGLAIAPAGKTLPDRVRRARLHRAIGRYAMTLGRPGQAYAATTAALAQFEGWDLDRLGPALNHYGSAAAEHALHAATLERDEEALAALARVDTLYAGASTMLEADRADIELARGRALVEMGRHDEAVAAVREAGRLYAPQFGAVGRNADSIDGWLATALTRAGRHGEAEVLLRRIRDAGTVRVWRHSAELALAQGQLAQADAWLQRFEAAPAPGNAGQDAAAGVLRLRWLVLSGRHAQAAEKAQALEAMARQQLGSPPRLLREIRDLHAQAQAQPARSLRP
jgi:eukaryotic-like serine/threonine-protein kinase